MSQKLFTQRIGLVGITNILTGISSIILLAITTKNLTLSEYGIWVQISVTLGLIPTFATLGLSGAIYRFLPKETDNNRKRDELFSIVFFVLIISLIISILIILILLSQAFSWFTGNEKIIIILALIIPVLCVDLILSAFFVAVGQMKRYSLFILFQTYGDIALMAYLIKFGLFGLLLSLLAIRIILFIFMAFYIVKDLGFAFPTFSRMREYFSYSLPLLSTRITTWVVEASDRYFIGYFLTSLYVGLYSPGYALGTMIYMIASPIEAVITPTLSKLYDSNKIDEVKKYLEYSLKYFLAFAIPSAFGLSVLSKKMLTVLSTGEIASSSYIITPFTALSMVLIGVCVLPTQILLLFQKTRVIGIAWIIAAIVNTLLNIFLIPSAGIIGAAIATLIAYGLITTIITYSSLKYLKFNIDWRFVLKTIIASVVMIIAILLADPSQKLDVLMWIGIGAAIYFSVLILLKGFTKEEVGFFRELFKI